MRLFPAALVVSISLSAFGAPMARVVGVIDGRTLLIANGHVARRVTLSGVLVAPADDQRAADYLRRTLLNSWALVEDDGKGGAFVYRSPDSLFVNGEMAHGAYRMTGPPMTYLGELDPEPGHDAPPRSKKSSAETSRRAVPQHRARSTPRGLHRIPRSRM